MIFSQAEMTAVHSSSGPEIILKASVLSVSPQLLGGMNTGIY